LRSHYFPFASWRLCALIYYRKEKEAAKKKKYDAPAYGRQAQFISSLVQLLSKPFAAYLLCVK
jgi:hypothetical protein